MYADAPHRYPVGVQVFEKIRTEGYLYADKTAYLWDLINSGGDYRFLSRPRRFGKTLNLPVEERMEATGAACVVGIMKGASIVRVHDVKPIVRMCRMTDVILRSGKNG